MSVGPLSVSNSGSGIALSAQDKVSLFASKNNVLVQKQGDKNNLT